MGVNTIKSGKSTAPAPEKHETLKLVAILIAAFLLRLLLARYETEAGVDSIHYILMGDNIAHGTSFDTWNTTGGRWVLPPTFPILIAFFRFLGMGLEWSGHMAAVAAGTVLIIPLYYVTRQLYGIRIAQIAAVIATFTPILVDYSIVILTELLFATFVLWMLLFILRTFSDREQWWDSLLSGLFCALAFLTKTFGIFLLPFLFLSFIFSRNPGKPRHTRTALALLGFLILAVPYWLFLHQYTGRWVMDGKGQGQQARIFARNLTEEHIDPRYSGELTEDHSDFLINVEPSGGRPEGLTIGRFLFNYVKKYVQKLVRIYQDFPYTPTYPNNVLLLYLFPTILLGLGIFTGPGRWSERHGDRFLLYWLCPFVFGLPLIFVEVRYFVPVIPLLVPFMAAGADTIAEWIVIRFTGMKGYIAKPHPIPAVAIVLTVFILLTLPKITYKITSWNNPMVSYNPRHEAAQWLSRSGIAPERIMEYGHSVSFYSGAQSILIPDGDLSSIITIARKYDVEYLSLDEFYLLRSHRRPQIEYLFDTDEPPPPELDRIYVDDRFPELKHVIYRIRAYNEIIPYRQMDWR